MSSNRNMGIDLDVSSKDMRELLSSLDSIKDTFSAKGANAKINKIVFDAAKPMTSVAKSLAPVGDTKTLKKSVGRWRTKTGVRVGARYRETDKNKGWYIHLASYTHKIRGGGMTEKSTPFLADAFESTKGITMKLITEGVNKLLKW